MSFEAELPAWKADQYMREYEHVFEGKEAREKYGDCVVSFEGRKWILLSAVVKMHHDHRSHSAPRLSKEDMFVKVFKGVSLNFDRGFGIVDRSSTAPWGDIYVRLDRVIYYKQDGTVFKTIFNMMRRQRWLEMFPDETEAGVHPGVGSSHKRNNPIHFNGEVEAVHSQDLPHTSPVEEIFQPILPMPAADGYRQIVPKPAKHQRTCTPRRIATNRIQSSKESASSSPSHATRG
ncbi:hypothetical protein PHYBOEH_005676 [Phytophthora boehmeriae]|uniref:Uncharacterized protein n=1 Tax=Phytophthora boehmeriae TaxID=109152 RepID=A0A8T1XDM7_9STRA|nr:hypothetical protein PHYBOEH_005676 [Phytophthora boehmeriae]